MSENDEALLTRLVGAFSGIAGIVAIALGGSRARGTAAAQSDYCLCQVLYVRNRAYLLNEKGAVAGVDGLTRRPAAFSTRVTEMFHELGSVPLAVTLAKLAALVSETEMLATAGL